MKSMMIGLVTTLTVASSVSAEAQDCHRNRRSSFSLSFYYTPPMLPPPPAYHAHESVTEVTPWGHQETRTFHYGPVHPENRAVIYPPAYPVYGHHEHEEARDVSPVGHQETRTYHYGPLHPTNRVVRYW